jgi:hypothetical protein
MLAACKAPGIVEFIGGIPENLSGMLLRGVLHEREEENGS